MCGILGIFYCKENRSETVLEKALRSLSHRGPDSHRTFINGPLLMGHTRLSIIDLEGGQQPLFSADENLVLVANGEIYNFIELREDLEKKGHRFLTRSDSETIIHCYAEYGEEFLGHLHGMFAFALYDRANGKLILARDRLGIKPLYLYQDAGGVFFASETKALWPLMDSKPTIDPVGLVQYLQNQFTTGHVTPFAGVERVKPGEALVIKKGEVRKRWTYWSALDVTPRDIDQSEAQAEFDELMETVMVTHMRSDVPFGLFLSGGTDSAILLALLSRLKSEPIRTFSVGFPGTSLADELPAAARMAKLFSTRHTVITPSADEIFGALPLTVWAADDLMRDNANLPTSILSAAAARELKVVFSGEGGDEVFAGYGRYRMPWLERMAKSLTARGSGGFRTRGTFRGPWPRRLFGSELRQADQRFREPFIEAWSSTPASWSSIQKMQYTDLVTAIPDNLLVKADRMMMAWGLEGRVPFLDHRVVEFGLSLPDKLKIRAGQGKLFLKRWASLVIPEDHLFTPKKGFHVPVGEFLDSGLRERMGKALQRNRAVNDWFHPEGVAQLVGESSKAPVMGRMLWTILQFAIWHRIFFEGSGERPEAKTDIMDFLD